MNDLNLFSKCKSTSNINGDEFVGIEYSDTDVTVFFPLGYEIPEDDDSCRESILTLLRTISLSKSIINEEVKLNDQLKEDYAFPISSYLWLLKDYLSNGIYKSKEQVVKKQNGGKVNWKKTLQQQPLIGNGQIVYLDMYTNHSLSIDDIITEIHILCLNDSIKHIGWLFGDYVLKKPSITFDNKDYLVNVLNQTLVNSHDDRKINLLINLRNVLLGLDVVSDDRSINNYGVKGFEDVWQIVVAKLFANEELTGYKPTVAYHLIHESSVKEKKPLRLDALLLKDGVYYVLDAKYYQFGVELSSAYAPHTSDVEKQIVYGEYVDLKHGGKTTVYNSFVIPYNKYNNKYIANYNKNIEYCGFSSSNWKKLDKNLKPYYVVAVVLVDCKFAIDNWVYNKCDEFINEIVDRILQIKPLLIQYGWTDIPTIN